MPVILSDSNKPIQ